MEYDLCFADITMPILIKAELFCHLPDAIVFRISAGSKCATLETAKSYSAIAALGGRCDLQSGEVRDKNWYTFNKAEYRGAVSALL